MHEDRVFPGGQRHPAAADRGWLLSDEPDGSLSRPWGSDSALDALQSLAREFSSPQQPLWCPASLRSGASGKAQVFRVRPGQSMHVVGASPLATELRRLLTARAEPGWELHPVPGGRSQLQVLAGPLRRLSGNGRFFNLLDRSGFAYVEEVTATPDECLTDLGNGGPGLVAAVRQVIGELAPGAASPANGMAPDGREPGTGSLPVLSPTTLRALKVVAGWAVAERGAHTAGDLIVAVGRTRELPPDVAAAWSHISQLELRQVVGLLFELLCAPIFFTHPRAVHYILMIHRNVIAKGKGHSDRTGFSAGATRRGADHEARCPAGDARGSRPAGRRDPPGARDGAL